MFRAAIVKTEKATEYTAPKRLKDIPTLGLKAARTKKSEDVKKVLTTSRHFRSTYYRGSGGHIWGHYFGIVCAVMRYFEDPSYIDLRVLSSTLQSAYIRYDKQWPVGVWGKVLLASDRLVCKEIRRAYPNPWKKS